MATDHRSQLSEIRTIRQLIAYLRDEMGWPIGADDFDALTFEYTPEELGIDAKNAAKIQEIKRLRPLSPRQPWGIFFVKFEPKKLPVVALRRILSQVALKRRASSNPAERQAWAADDLLFISNYGEGDERQIAFAHFSQPADRDDLPTLKVLGWDNLDTPLHLDDVARELTENLTWPEDGDVETWRERWRAAFVLRHREVITTSRELSIRLAELARAIRDRTKTALAIETERGPLRKLMKAFQEALIHDLDTDGFADMYAQTIAYGLLSARIADPHRRTADDFASHMRTNPFLRELMETFLKVGGRRGKAGGPGVDFDELGVNEVVELLDAANMEAVVRDFGDKNPQEDPVIHFYESFLAAYDKKQKVSRGVFYTPRPVVSYIVRSVDELLRTELGLDDGLADITTWGEMVRRHKDLTVPEGISPEQDFVQILDPACGTGTFLVEVIDLVHKRMVEKWKTQDHDGKKIDALWNEYVLRHLLPRLHGYELLMAPYAIAHLKIGLKLYETGYRFRSDKRARIYLTNTLEPPEDFSGRLAFDVPALAHEAQAVNEIKRRQFFSILIGNPPYSNYGQLNRIPLILGLLEDYKRGLDEKKLNLDDDFIKFIRFSQHTVQRVPFGIVGLITNNVYLDGITHRRMRESLAETFSEIRVLDLHGNSKRRERAPDGGKDENVFDILIGVAISVFRRSLASDNATVLHSDLWGLRASKYDRLLVESVARTRWKVAEAKAPNYFFVPKDFSIEEEYNAAFKIEEAFVIHQNGLKTDRDELFYDYDKALLSERVRVLFSKRYGQDFKKRFRVVASTSFDIEERREQTSFEEDFIRECLYRPFDLRWLYYDPKLTSRPAEKVMRHMMVPNLALITGRQSQVIGNLEWDLITCSASLVDTNLFYRGGNIVFPLYLADEGVNLALTQVQKRKGRTVHGRRMNYSSVFVEALSKSLSLRQSGDGSLPLNIEADDIFQYAYAILHSPSYRRRYAEFLKVDFPRIPLPGSLTFFQILARLGQGLVALHLLDSPLLNKIETTYDGPKNPQILRVGWADETVWLDANRTSARDGKIASLPGSIGFKGVPKDVWDFHIGGYQVCHKWVSDRKGRKLSREDLHHYQRITVAIKETIRLMKEIDEVIERHGGWPGAFQSARILEEPGARSQGRGATGEIQSFKR